MYILIELVPVATGTGFGVFCCVVLGLALLFIMAQYAMTWLLAPVAITMTLLQNETLWWILPTLLVVGVVVNWLFATSKAWFPFMPALLTLIMAIIGAIVGLIIDPPQDGQLWILLLAPVVIVLLAIIYYPLLNMVLTVSSITTLPCGYKPCLGAIASFVGMVGGALCIQGMVEGVVGWFGESTFLEQLQLSVDTKFVSDIMLAKVLEIKESTWQQLQGVVDAVKSIPVGLRFLLGLAAVIGCGFCEHYCADGNSLF